MKSAPQHLSSRFPVPRTGRIVRVWCSIATLLGAIFISPVAAQNTVLGYDQHWKFNIPISDPGTSWRNVEFDDSSWGSGPGFLGFYSTALPDPGLRTTVGSAFTNQIVYLFRTKFSYAGPLQGAMYSIDQVVDDGVTYYLNGVPLGSWNHTPGAWDNVASPGVNVAAEQIDILRGNAPSLRVGENVLSAEVHQRGTNGSDLAFGARLRINLPAQNSSDWRLQHFDSSAPSGSAADLFDADEDGLANILEYALCENPRQARIKWSRVKIEDSNLTMEYVRRKAALSEFDFSCVWSANVSSGWTGAGVTQEILGDDGSVQFVKASVPLNGSTAKFFKVQITRNALPIPPSGLVATVYQSDKVDLSWTDNSSVESGYRVERKTSGQAFVAVASLPPGTTSFRDNNLNPGVSYIYRVTALSGVGASAFSSETIVTPEYISISADEPSPAIVETSVTFSASATGGAAEYFWNFGDGTTISTSSGTASHVYSAPGHYSVIVQAWRGDEWDTLSFIQTIHYPSTPLRPTHSSPIIIDEERRRVWNVNPDTNTVSVIHADNFTKQFEKPVGTTPSSLAQAPDDTIWVVCKKSATVSVLSPTTGDLITTISLPRASQPFGIAFSPDGSAAFVSLQGSGYLVKLNPVSRSVTASVYIGATPRAVAITHDSQRALVTRFISPAHRGEVTEINAQSMTVTRVFELAEDTTTIDNDGAARGVPNYLVAVAVSPDGRRAWTSSKKDNTLRGTFRDGNALTFEKTVRTITTQLDLLNNQEFPGGRVDFNDSDSASAVAFSPLGDYVFVALQGSNVITTRDAFGNLRVVSSSVTAGRAPQGLALSADGSRLFVQNFMSRSVGVFDTSGIVASRSSTLLEIAHVPVVATETLSPAVLLGKQIFYNANDQRMNRDGYITCASCHLDGGQDGRVWDFTDRGEGLRNTTTLLGKSGMGHGRVHWTANFDEIQDFENDIRNNFGGIGFMTAAQFNTGTRSNPLGNPKAGVSPELDALAAYVASLIAVEPSPYRNQDGSLTADGIAGQQIFQQLNCASCHSGPDFTDSTSGVLHDVGTIQPASGKRIGAALTGLDTPTLRGVWSTAPYLHDGSASTLGDVINRAAAQPAQLHGSVGTLSPQQRSQLVAYLLQLE